MLILDSTPKNIRIDGYRDKRTAITEHQESFKFWTLINCSFSEGLWKTFVSHWLNF